MVAEAAGSGIRGLAGVAGRAVDRVVLWWACVSVAHAAAQAARREVPAPGHRWALLPAHRWELVAAAEEADLQ